MRRDQTNRPPGPGPSGGATAPGGPDGAQLMRRADGSETMHAWERYLSGDPLAIASMCSYVVASWQRSLAFGVNPSGRAAPLAAAGDGVAQLRHRQRDLLSAAGQIFADVTDLFAGSRSIMLLTNADGVVLEAVGDMLTLEQGQNIHLMQGGDWREDVVGTNGIGTALATGRPAQVHAAEHFCEGIKRWTCAAAPIFEPGTGAILGVVDISGPPSTYQRNNLTLAVSTARQIEAAISARVAHERSHLLEACLQRLSSADAAGLIAIDRNGRLVHATGRIAAPVKVGQRLPGLDANTSVEDWAGRLPAGWRPEWFSPVSFGGRAIGALLVAPPPRSAASRLSVQASEGDPDRSSFEHIIGAGPAMTTVIARARQLARRRVPLLIEGETGTGKELLARAIHGEGSAAGGGRAPFIAFNCGAVPKDLLAGELFGHVRGAFTGATSEGRAGRFELAHQGTLCLDEIGELPLELQPMLLRVLEEGVVYRLGDMQPRRVDVRLIAMTNRTLRHEVEAGRFRRDLYHRIGVTSLTVPPLRARADDIDVLVNHFNHRLAARHHQPARRFAPETMAVLRAFPWHGNVRELRNVIEGLMLGETDAVVTPGDLPPELQTRPRDAAPPPASLESAERAMIQQVLRQVRGNMAAAARLLGISRSTLYRKIQHPRVE
jgi:transcriptional regulator of acetoin/glycerol metabolism